MKSHRVKELSDAYILLTEGALYPALHKLEAEGLLETEVVSIGKRIEKYYMFTSPGNNQAKERVAEFVDFIQTMGSVLLVKWN